jgi:hypothetical protein
MKLATRTKIILLLLFCLPIGWGVLSASDSGDDDDDEDEENCEDVCEQAVAAGLDRTNWGVPELDRTYKGLVICCGGEPYPCLFENNWPSDAYPPDTGPDTPPGENACLDDIRKCAMDHEKGHIDYGVSCGDGLVPASPEGEPDEILCKALHTECQEYKKQKACLEKLTVPPCDTEVLIYWFNHVLLTFTPSVDTAERDLPMHGGSNP